MKPEEWHWKVSDGDGSSSCALVNYTMIRSQFVAQSYWIKVIRQAYPFVFHEDSSVRSWKGDGEQWVNEVEQILRSFGPQYKALRNCPSFAVVFICFPVWIHSITSLLMMVLYFCLVLFPALLPLPLLFLIFSHFLSIPSPLHSHQSVLVQINCPEPFSFYRQLSNLITIFWLLRPILNSSHVIFNPLLHSQHFFCFSLLCQLW